MLHALLCFSWCTWCAHSLAVSYVLSHSLKGHLKWSGLFPSQVLVHLVTSRTTSTTLVSSSPHVGTHFANIHVHGRCRFIVYASISSLFAKCYCASSLCGASDGQRCWSCSHSRDNRASWAGGSCLGEPSNHLGRWNSCHLLCEEKNYGIYHKHKLKMRTFPSRDFNYFLCT